MYAITSHNCVHSENSTKYISEIILGILQEDNTDDTYENNTCFIIIIIIIHSSLEPIVGAGRPAETWSGSTLWASRPYTLQFKPSLDGTWRV